MAEEKKGPNPILNLFRLTWKYSLGRRHLVILVFVLFTIAVGIELLTPYIIGRIFNAIQESEGGKALFRTILFHLSLLVILQIGFWGFHGTGRILERKNAFYVKLNYKKEAINQVLELSPGWHRDHHSGDTIDKINRAASAMGRFSGLLFAPIQAILVLTGAFIILAFIDLKSALIAIVFSAVSIFIIYRFDNVLSKQYKRLYLHENFIASAVHDFVSNIVTIITLRLKKMASKEVLVRMLKPFRLYHKNIVLNEIKWFFASMGVTTMIVVVLILYSYDQITTTGTVLIGTLFMLYRYVDRIGDTFFEFAYRYGDMIEQNASVVAMDPLKQAYGKVPLVEKQPKLPVNWKKIEIKSLYFSYEDKKHKRHHMNNIDVILRRKQRIAFVGESGSGKSTLLALLRGLYHTRFVDVYVDDKKMEFGLKHLSEHVTLIPQEPEIFNNTIKNNITLGLRFSDSAVGDVTKIAAFDPVIKRLPKGLRSSISEKGVNLSGGEKQRLALARGLLAGEKSDILLLDEPTSSVDSKNELRIYQDLLKKYSQKTIISSIHRLHLLKFFDYIYYFWDGKIVAEGTLKGLMKNKSFQRIWREYHRKG
ncbi:MAG: ABC transporter ATP-binding protein [Candidatus Woesearchaeota archaeon]